MNREDPLDVEARNRGAQMRREGKSMVPSRVDWQYIYDTLLFRARYQRKKLRKAEAAKTAHPMLLAYLRQDSEIAMDLAGKVAP